MCFQEIHTLANVHDTCANPEENGSVNNKNTLQHIAWKINMPKVLFINTLLLTVWEFTNLGLATIWNPLH